MKNIKRITGLFLSMCMTASCAGVSSLAVSAEPVDLSTYSLTIPAALSVKTDGWNEIEGGVTAKGSLEEGDKLIVTAESDNSWKLVSGENSIGYNLAKEDADYSAEAEVPSWEFETLDNEGTSQPAGIIVDDYSEKPVGTYQDVVTFKASVESPASAATVLSGAFEKDAVITVNFKWRGIDQGDYVSGTYDGTSFTASAGGNYWGLDLGRRAVYKVEKNGNEIIIGAGNYNYDDEAITFILDAETDTYKVELGGYAADHPEYYDLVSVKLNDVDITNQLTKKELSEKS